MDYPPRALKNYRYGKDPLCWGSIIAYGLNRWVVSPHGHWPLLQNHGNDFLLIPAALPLILWLQRKLGLRRHDGFPQFSEVLFHLALWSLLFEVIGPRFVAHATGDAGDIVAYTLGAFFAGIFWEIPVSLDGPP